VLDLTANYVPRSDKVLQEAIKKNGEALKSFVTAQVPNNWRKVKGDGVAWKEEDRLQFLSQFGDNYDLQMDEPANQERLIDVLNKLVSFGVKGFRLKNAKHFIISTDLSDEVVNSPTKAEPYQQQTHTKTTYLQGLDTVIHKFTKAVHTATDGEGFLTIDDGDSLYTHVFVMDNTTHYAFDLPRFDFLTHFFKNSTPSHKDIPKQLFNGFNGLINTIDMLNLWMQVAYSPDFTKTGLAGSAYNMFMSLLPGVQVVPFETLNYSGNKTETMKKLEEARESPVFQHGNFNYMMSADENAFGYVR
jgi:solute carrier family 3, member 2